MRYIFLFTVFVLYTLIGTQPSYAQGANLQISRLDCGKIKALDLSMFSSKGAYKGMEKQLVSSCYFIRHGDQFMVWDSGFAKTDPNDNFVYETGEDLRTQLAALNIEVEDVDYIGLSHTHGDHSGMADSFTNATLLIQKAEAETSETVAEECHLHTKDIAHFTASEEMKHVKLLEGDYDVFGDGRAKIISAPGHSPGHQVLLLRLDNAGHVMLSGDQWHFIENYETDDYPSFNCNASDTESSMVKLKQMIVDLDADLVIQHEPQHVSKIPAFPKFLD
jgi:N-acyl homoserine lactone hydrolase